MTRIRSLPLVLGLTALVVACGGTAPAADAPPEPAPETTEPAPAQPASSPEAAPPSEAPASGDEAPAPSGKRAPCTLGQDQTCNDDPSVSALWGRCTELGVCECKEGFELSPRSARCQPKR